MGESDAPYHAHIYYSVEELPAAKALRDDFAAGTPQSYLSAG